MNPLRHPRAPVLFLAHVCASALLLIFGASFGLAWPYLPTIEGYLLPIVTAGPPPHDEAQPARDINHACFSLDMHKVRRAVPIVYQFAVEVRQNEHWLSPSTLYAHIANDDNTAAVDDYLEHPVGERWRRRWCFDMPASIAGWQAIRVSGFAVHRAHPLWRTETPLPSIVIAGISP